jgi:hypothetical protein
MRPALVIPQPLKPPRTERYIPPGVANIAMPQIRGNQKNVAAAFPHVISAGVAEHVRMRLQGGEASSFRHPVNHQPDAALAHGAAKFRDENIIASLLAFSLQSPKRADFPSAQSMIAANASFFPFDVENTVVQVQLVPAQLEPLFNPQPVREQHQNKRRIPQAIAIFARRFDQLLHLAFEQVFAHSRTALGDCSHYGDWNYVAHARNPQLLHRVAPMYYSEKEQKGNSLMRWPWSLRFAPRMEG